MIDGKSITIANFEKIDFRIGTVLAVKPFPKARNPSYQLDIDFGDIGIKTSSAQLPANYTIEQALNKKVLGVTNLSVRRIAGFKSEALIVGFPDLQGNVQLLNTRDYNVENRSLIIKKKDQINEIDYNDFESVNVRSATITDIKPADDYSESFYIELDAGEYGQCQALLEQTQADTSHFLNGQVAVIIGAEQSTGDRPTVKLFTFPVFKNNDSRHQMYHIPFGIDGYVENGKKLF